MFLIYFHINYIKITLEKIHWNITEAIMACLLCLNVFAFWQSKMFGLSLNSTSLLWCYSDIVFRAGSQLMGSGWQRLVSLGVQLIKFWPLWRVYFVGPRRIIFPLPKHSSPLYNTANCKVKKTVKLRY